jgi:phosphoribosylaminoimidazole-succinocarboxamide synthase
VRGYLSGSAWQEYKRSGTVNGVPVPAGMQESEQLPVPLFTPSTKAEQGEHDENINFEDAGAIVGGRRSTWRARSRSSCTAWHRSSR